jgi:hypothetical protein
MDRDDRIFCLDAAAFTMTQSPREIGSTIAICSDETEAEPEPKRAPQRSRAPSMRAIEVTSESNRFSRPFPC